MAHLGRNEPPPPETPTIALTPPPDLAGPLSVKINNGSGWNLCSFRLIPKGRPDAGNSWIPPDKALSGNGAGSVGTFSVKSGRYLAVSDSCPVEAGARGAHVVTEVNIDKPWEIFVNTEAYAGIYGGSTDHSAEIVFPAIHYASRPAEQAPAGDPNCVKDGAEVASNQSCCNGAYHVEVVGANREPFNICGPAR